MFPPRCAVSSGPGMWQLASSVQSDGCVRIIMTGTRDRGWITGSPPQKNTTLAGSGSTISTNRYHDKINPKDFQILSLGDSVFLPFFTVETQVMTRHTPPAASRERENISQPPWEGFPVIVSRRVGTPYWLLVM